jgi:hypothetical protein
VSKVALLSGGTVLGAAALSLLASWWHSPLDELFQDGRWTFFDVIGLAPVAYAAFALAIGVAAGTLLVRMVPAMALAAFLFAATRIVVNFLRPWFLPPVVREVPLGQTFPRGAMQIDLYWLDVSNHRILWEEISPILQQVFPEQPTQGSQFGGSTGAVGHITPESATQVAQMGQYLHEHGFRNLAVFEPGDRFWTFQAIETAIYLVLSVILLIVCTWLVQNRLR